MHLEQRRRDALAADLPETVDAVLVLSEVNVRYLSGLNTSNGGVLLTRDGRAVLATDGRYATKARSDAGDLELIEVRAIGRELLARASGWGVSRLGVERDHLTLAAYESLRDAAGSGVELVGLSGAVEAQRAVKDEHELALLATACEITDKAFDVVIGQLRAGITERDVAWLLHEAMHDHGAEGLAFDSIVAAGEHSAIPHHDPTDRPLASGDLVKLDYGAKYGGYHADMTRTVVLGRAADWQRDLHDFVRALQRQCRAAAVPGALPADLDRLAAGRITDAGHHVAHGLGHGVGLEIHESPLLVAGSTADRLEMNVPVTIEPGVYLPGRGGVRIEDTIVVGDPTVGNGGARLLTTSDRDLLEVG